MRSIVLLALAVAVAPMALPPAHAQNLLLNPGFDTDLAGWNLFNAFDVTAAWNAADEYGNPASGSMRGNLPAIGTFRMPIYATQCVAVQGGTTYRFGGSVLLPSATTPPNAFATVFANLYEEPGCSGNHRLHQPAPNVTVRDAWTRTQETVAAAPTDRSLQFNLRVYAPTGTDLTSHFDNLFIEALPDAIFTDGFD